MALRDEMEEIVDEYKKKQGLLAHNAKMIDIFEGNLSPYLLATLKANLNPKSYEQIKDRLVPINILRRLVDKMSKIYQKGVVRRVHDGSDADSEMVTEYESRMKFNDRMNRANEYYNMFKYAMVRPVSWRGRSLLKPVANDRYFVMSKDPIDDLNPTHNVFIDRIDQSLDGKGDCVVFHAYTDTEFLVFDDRMRVRDAEMAAYQNPGVNPFGVLPGQYFNRSTNYLMPKPDEDLLKMIILIPVLLTDLAFAIKFQAFAILYGINIDFEDLTRAPDAIWLFKTDGLGDDKKPEIGTIKPDVDIDQVIRYTQAVVSLFLQSRGIRPGTVGQLTAENFSSGISKIIDEMDTFEDRNSQIETFKPGEEQLWNNIVHRFHPVWRANGHVDISHQFSKNAYVTVDFPEQIPMQDRGQLVSDQEKEYKAGFTTRKRAIKKLNPGMSDEEIDELLEEIKAEKQENAAAFGVPTSGTSDEVTDEETADGVAEG